MRRILLLMAHTGGGHRSAAEATMEALEAQYGSEITATMLDASRRYFPYPLSRMDAIYRDIIRFGKNLWSSSFRWFNTAQRSSAAIGVFWPFVRRGLVRMLLEHPADLIVSFHWMYNYPLWWARQAGRRPPRVITLVTDLVNPHALWFAPGAAKYLVPTNAAAGYALTSGIPPECIMTTGLPISLRFGRALSLDQASVRNEMALERERLTVLVMGGGDGMGEVYRVAEAVATAGVPLQMIVVAGRNDALREKLEKANWPVRKIVLGFTRDVPQLMRAADILVTKAGPSTIAEALACGLPIILSDYIRGQEDGNRWLVEDGGAGLYCSNPSQIASTLNRWFTEKDSLLPRLRAASHKQGHPEAASEVARVIYDLSSPR
jgi:1,2-diacylglycerol 3-beta-galactosyltransferase